MWIDTRLDVPKPMIGKLIAIAAEHGFLNPFPHQALSDVLTMLRILDEYDFEAVLARARIPNIMVEFVGPFESKDHAKECGFYWNGFSNQSNGGRPTKQWLKTIKECDFAREDQAARPYKIRRVTSR
jgi:DNA polymerase-3 subunit epsilon